MDANGKRKKQLKGKTSNTRGQNKNILYYLVIYFFQNNRLSFTKFINQFATLT